MIKEIRIVESTGMALERDVEASKNPHHDGPDKVKWVVTPPSSDNPAFTVVFGPDTPFDGVTEIEVPGRPGGSHQESIDVNAQLNRPYKYSIRRGDKTGPLTDDPNIIIRS